MDSELTELPNGFAAQNATDLIGEPIRVEGFS